MADLFQSPKDFSSYLVRVTDNGGASADRYTVTFADGTYLALSSNPTHPLGVSLAGDGIDPRVQQEHVESGEEIDLALGDLDPDLVKHIIARNNGGFRDFFAYVESEHHNTVFKNRESADENDGMPASIGVGIYKTDQGFMIKTDDPERDHGPFATAREVMLATLPDAYAYSGEEYHSTIADVSSMEPTPGVKEKIAELEQKVHAEHQQSRSIFG
jgi:hypothetical protein